MPKNIKKQDIIKDIKDDLLLLKDIAKKYDVSLSYISHVKKEIWKIDYKQLLRFLYNFMERYMQPTEERPSNDYLDKIGEIGDILNAIKR